MMQLWCARTHRTWDQLTDQGFLLVLVCAPPLVRRESPLRKEFMSRKQGAQSIKILVNHWRWVEANGYKQQAASCKRQAASLTKENYNVIQEYKGERYVEKRSKTNNRRAV